MKSRDIEKLMKKALKALHAGARRSNAANPRGADEWLRDNYYILERETRLAIKQCALCTRNYRGSDLLPGLFNTCKHLCPAGKLPCAQELESYFTKNGLSGAGAQLLELSLKCALIDYAAAACKMDDGAVQMGNAVKSLRAIKETDFELIIERSSEVEKLLMDDPAGVYPAMDSRTRSLYRDSIVERSLKTGSSEISIAKRALEKAREGKTERERHVGSYIVKPKSHAVRGTVFIVLEALIPAALCTLAACLTQYRLWAFLLYLPLWEALRPLLELLSVKGVETKYLPRMACESEKVENIPALITVSTLLPAAADGEKLKNRLAKLYQSNATGEIKVCCLADFKGAGMPRKPEDSAAVASACRVIDELNAKHGGGFLLALRPRVYSKTQNEFTGRERKMGAICDLVKAIKGDDTAFEVLHGDRSTLTKTRYLIALDSDTGLVFDTARDMIAVASHPLNTPVTDGSPGKVTRGYGIIVPSARPELADETATPFMRLMAGDGGITAYDSLCGERYQDLFGEGIFSGKGIIDVDAYNTVIRGLPKEKILSHDIIESGLLRAGFASEMQIIDGFPMRAGSYFSRLHRWVRGDWQNARFIFGKNRLNALSRYKLFDNLRRSLTPVISAAVMLISLLFDSRAAWAAVIIALLSAAAPGLLAALHSLTHGGFSVFSRLYYSKSLPSASLAVLRSLIGMIMLFQTAYCCLNAIAKALWRMLITKRRLLEWTTAAHSESTSDVGSVICSCAPSLLCGALLLIFGKPIHLAAAIVALLYVPFALLSGRQGHKNEIKVSQKSREKLLSYAAAMWRFFDEQCGKENNFLPPDNIQESPVRAVARRTSPTNIGLMLMSFLAARDFGFITTADLYMRLNLSLGSIEKLEKYEGNLLNWYSTQTLEPLGQDFVSTVDSGNFLCCLTALRQGLGEYVGECESLGAIIARITAIIDATSLSALYNPRRKLFWIGVDAKTGKPSDSCYDLYMSEARMTAYYAVARREIPKKHWGALGRIIVGDGRYTGLVSWTGTMFEYFMPNLFIPAPEGSLTWESLQFCLWCQQKRTGGKPWGISESGFYAFDGDLNYQYKAHGVAKIGLKKGLNSELVVAPYASFLTLPMAPNSSLKNLKKLEKLGLTGRYGFYEALDYTRGRCRRDEPSAVSSFMAHHVGMSLLGVLNTLEDSIVSRRFMADDAMSGADTLLLEKIPAGAAVFKDVDNREIPKIRERTEGKNKVSQAPTPLSPEVRLYSNGGWTTVISDVGTGVSMLDGVDITCRDRDILCRPQGIFAYFRSESAAIPFTAAPEYPKDVKFRAEFQENRAIHRARQGNIKLKMTTRVLQRDNCEQRVFCVENTASKASLAGNLIVYFEPCLADYESFAAHPAFLRLFVEDEICREEKLIAFTRRTREGETPMSIAAGLREDSEVYFETSRERMLICGEGIASLGKNKGDFDGGRGNPDACAAFSIPIKLKPHEKREYTLLIVARETKQEAIDALLTLRIRRQGEKFASDPFYKNMLENAVAAQILPAVLYPSVAGMQRLESGPAFPKFTKEELWSFGISGEYPIVLAEISDADEVAALRPYVRINRTLRSCGIMSDFVVSFSEDEGYGSPTAQAVRQLLREESCEMMLGVSCGVHTANMSLHSYNQREALICSAAAITGENQADVNERKTAFSLQIRKAQPPEEKQSNVKGFNFTNGKITIYKSGKFPYVPWCLTICNQNFGTLVSDKSLGFTWALNSHENKITPWHNDTRSDNRGELILARINGELFDLISGARATFSPGLACWRASSAGVDFCVSVSVAKRGMDKRIRAELWNAGASEIELDLAYFTEPVLGSDATRPWLVFGRKTESGALIFSNLCDIPGFAALSCSAPCDFVCFDRAAFLSGDWEKRSELPCKNPCVAVGRHIKLAPGGKTELTFDMSWGASERAALEIPHKAVFESPAEPPVTIDTPDEELNALFNSFLYEQVRSCRFYARTGFYQCGGAWGFRDQLQDSLAFLLTEPEITRTHLIRCAAVQFERGDVLHWWHVIVAKTQKIKGVRTRCSDDLLWLPYVCAEYVEKTGDASVLAVQAPYISGEELHSGENERYFEPERTKYSESLLLHCLRAVDLSLARLGDGENALPPIGSCDWNDGMSRVGQAGGESVWLAQFMIIVLEKIAPLCAKNGMAEKADEYCASAQRLRKAVDEKGWDGDKYIRAFYGDGEPLGADGSGGDVDILPQAFSVFAATGDAERRSAALKTAADRLIDSKHRVAALLSPPFDADYVPMAGYVAAYPCGIRENGGQYTHAAVWLAKAMLAHGLRRDGFDLMSMLNPYSFYSDKKSAEVYRAEPYALAGDVSYAPEIEGRGGWTQYTGAAAWYYRTVIEDYLGIHQTDGALTITPALPHWCKGAGVVIRQNDAQIGIKILNSGKNGMVSDGERTDRILLDNKDHDAVFGV